MGLTVINCRRQLRLLKVEPDHEHIMSKAFAGCPNHASCATELLKPTTLAKLGNECTMDSVTKYVKLRKPHADHVFGRHGRRMSNQFSAAAVWLDTAPLPTASGGVGEPPQQAGPTVVGTQDFSLDVMD